MSVGRSVSLVSLGALLVMLTSGGCDGTETTGSSCPAGSERCACYKNQTCDDGLVCLSKTCVSDDPSGAGRSGSNPTSGAGTNATNRGGAGANEAGGSSTITGQAGAGVGGTTDLGAGGLGGNGGTTPIGAGGVGVGGVGVGGATVIGAGGAFATGGTTVTGVGGAIGIGGTNSAGAGQNSIKNGDFSLDGAYWHVTSSTNVILSTSSIMDGTFCVTALSGETNQIIGWPVLATDAANLRPGATYSLSFRARATYSAYLAVKVATAVTPWLPTLTTITSSAVSTTWQQYRTTFLAQGTATYPLTATTPVGLAFTVSSFANGLVCLDDVVLAEVL